MIQAIKRLLDRRYKTMAILLSETVCSGVIGKFDIPWTIKRNVYAESAYRDYTLFLAELAIETEASIKECLRLLLETFE